jgi:phosphoribosylanthranilate isomerase
VAERLRLPRVKVCGLRRTEDAAAAVAAGADALGLVLHPPSPRHLEPREAAELVATLPPDVLPVLVTLERAPEALERLARDLGVRAVQLCGAEHAADWRGFPLPLLRRLPVDASAEAELDEWCDVAAGFVLDHPAAPGGTGRDVDLDLAARLAAAAPCLLAGGLDAGSVSAAVERVRPAGVDASSRLESAPGAKDPARIAAFVRAALAAFQEVNA